MDAEGSFHVALAWSFGFGGLFFGLVIFFFFTGIYMGFMSALEFGFFALWLTWAPVSA